MRRLAFIVLLLPTAAFAQPGVDPSTPVEPVDPSTPVEPAAPEPAPPPALPPGPPSPAYVQPALPPPPMMPVPPAPDRFAYHRGFTFEANLGIGFAQASLSGADYDTMSTETDSSFAGAIGLGGWLSPHLALTGRISGVDLRDSSGTANNITVTAFVGPSLQYWIGPQFWIGGGAGIATLSAVTGCTDSCSIKGFGLDLRAGYSFGDTENTFNVSVELTPGVYDGGVGPETITGVALLAGYQFL